MEKENKVQIIVHCREYEKKKQIIEKYGKSVQTPMISAYVIKSMKQKWNP